MRSKSGKKLSSLTDRPLTDRQRLFVAEYLRDLNASQAARRAGYSKRTAKQMGTENLSKPAIAAAIQTAFIKRLERTQIDADYVLRQAVKLHERCMQAEPVLDKTGNPTGVYRFDAAGACRALELVGKHINVQAFREQHEHTGANGGPIVWRTEIMPPSQTKLTVVA